MECHGAWVHTIVAAACAGALLAQAPAIGAGKRIAIEVLTEHAGKQVPRIAEPKPGEKACPAFSVDGRKLAWRVAGKKLDDADAIAIELLRLAKDPASFVADPDRPGEMVLLPVVVSAPATTYWRDVVEVVDLALAAGFPDVQCEPSAAPFRPWWVAKSVGDPVRAEHTVVVPKAVFNEPDDRPAPGRPVVHVLQDGRVEIGGATVFHPRKLDGAKALREALERLARSAGERDGSTRFGPDRVELLESHLLIHADQWAPWSSVRAVAHAATEIRPAFWRLEYATAEEDFEARLRRGDRFPDAPAGSPGDKR